MLELPDRDKRETSSKKRPLRRAELLLDVSNRLALSTTLDEAFRTMRDIAAQIIGTERGSIFLNDPTTNELYSRISGRFMREIRLLNNAGVAGSVFSSGQGAIIHDAYADERFNRTIDKQTGFVTRSILCAPLRTLKGDLIGVAQLLNKIDGQFSEADLALLEAIISQASVSLESFRTIEAIDKSRRQELDFLSVVSEISSELKLGPLLQKIMAAITRMLDAERSTLFINDEKTKELYTEIGQGLGATSIRLPNHLGIAGTVFTSGQSVNIPHAYADLRFNPAFDRQTGFFTRSILCVPVTNKTGKVIGVTQVLNKRGSSFTADDGTRLKAFTSQISIGLENAKLFDDVQNIKNYNESILESMTNGVITMNEDGKIVTCNAAGCRIFKVALADILDRPSADFFTGENAWLIEKVKTVVETGRDEVFVDTQLVVGEDRLSVNVTVMPLASANDKMLGSLVMVEDISSEKRMKSTMSRYMDPALADQLLASGADLLGGHSVEATILFSDVRSFTTLSEELGPQGIISLLNEYFTLMVDCLTEQGGMLDKFIGDAIMAVFGTARRHEDDADRAVRSAIGMMTELAGFNQRRLADGKRPIDIGIGINTDTVVSGNIGSPKRQDYTVIGDGVNLAARLESACKQYGAHILISEYTIKKLKGTYRAREIDRVVVKGKTKPVAIFEIVDYHTDDTFPNMMEVLQAFHYGLKAYREGHFEQALKGFQDGQSLHPNDAATRMYIERCQHLIAEPPGADWDGVWVMKSK
ncbi:MAG TPA: GAF domain-containing protein [Telmatospirillum sp.]|nr:GAF domain-containing protein [Telmatospirillum sp.]